MIFSIPKRNSRIDLFTNIVSLSYKLYNIIESFDKLLLDCSHRSEYLYVYYLRKETYPSVFERNRWMRSSIFTLRDARHICFLGIVTRDFQPPKYKKQRWRNKKHYIPRNTYNYSLKCPLSLTHNFISSEFIKMLNSYHLL